MALHGKHQPGLKYVRAQGLSKPAPPSALVLMVQQIWLATLGHAGIVVSQNRTGGHPYSASPSPGMPAISPTDGLRLGSSGCLHVRVADAAMHESHYLVAPTQRRR
ncbi:MAG: hypothetical protein U0Q11_20660 [Vicinamibacterales bacterium]